jgi:hypothetical protein
MNKILIVILLAAGGIASVAAQQLPPPPPQVPPAEELATIPGVSSAQQGEIRRILVQRRNAQEDIHTKMREQFDALHAKERNEHERVDEQASEQLRKLLGDDGYRAYADWTVAHRGPPGMPRAHGAHGSPEFPRPGAPAPGHAAPMDDE